MWLIDGATLDGFNTLANEYLVFLVHVLSSSLMQGSDKIRIFNAAEAIFRETRANAIKTASGVNGYNIEEKRNYAKKTILQTETDIRNEIDRHGRQIKINSGALFLMNNIVERLKTGDNGIRLTAAGIADLYSPNELNTDEKEKAEKISAAKDDLKKKMNTDLDEIRAKAFLKMLYRKNVRPERFYQVNAFILEKCHSEKPELLLSGNVDETRDGLFFVMDRENLGIRRKKSNALIAYTLSFSEADTAFNIRITGSIAVNGREETFLIDETYPATRRGEVLNAFNIKGLIGIFNSLYNEKNIQADDPDSGDIDAYLNGTIDNG